MEEMDVCEMDTRAGLFFPEESGADNSVSRLILSNKLLYNLCSFACKLVYLEKSLSSKMVYMEWKMIFSYIWHINQWLLFLYLMNIINLEHDTSLLVWTSVERNI